MLLFAVSNPIQQLSFFLVAYLLNPFMKNGREKSQKFRKFLLGGHENWESLQQAVIA